MASDQPLDSWWEVLAEDAEGYDILLYGLAVFGG